MCPVASWVSASPIWKKDRRQQTENRDGYTSEEGKGAGKRGKEADGEGGFLSNAGVELLLGEVLDGRGKQSPHWAVL